MCTAAAYKTQSFYFGRTLDHYHTYGEEVAVLPRNKPLGFRQMGPVCSHYAMVGMAHVAEGTPLYYEAMNEKGLGMAGLNFVGNAHYFSPASGYDNVEPYEFIPWILSQCATVQEARARLRKLRLTNTPFSEKLPLAQLHWMIADIRESVPEGLMVYDNPAGVLTNNPPFPQQMSRLTSFVGLSPLPPENRFSKELPLKPDSLGMGAMGLPGDLSSPSRFVRAAFVRANSISGPSEEESVSQFFHILGSVEQQRGASRLENGQCEITVYACCCSARTLTYYYTTYENRGITAVDLRREDLNGTRLIRYPMLQEQKLFFQN